MRLLRNQVLAVVGHKPGRSDELPPFEAQHPLLAATMGLARDPEKNAERIVGALQALQSTRVDAA